MARAIRAPKPISTYTPARASRQEVELRKMAALVQGEEDLRRIWEKMRPEIRQQALDRIKPFLRFRPSEDVLTHKSGAAILPT